MRTIPPGVGPDMSDPTDLNGELLRPWDQPQTLLRGYGGPTGRGALVPSLTGGSLIPPSRDLVRKSAWVAMQHQYARLISLNFTVPSANSIKIIDEAAEYRNFLGLRNASTTANLYVDFGKEASIEGTWLRIIPGYMILFDMVVPQDEIFCIADAAGGALVIAYSNISLLDAEHC